MQSQVCRTCGTVNRRRARYCKQCGAVPLVPCAACGATTRRNDASLRRPLLLPLRPGAHRTGRGSFSQFYSGCC